MTDKTKNVITTIASSVEGYVIYLAQGVSQQDPSRFPAPFNHEALQSVYPHINKVIGDIAIFFIVAIVALQIIFFFLTENDYKNWLSKLFQHIIDQSLGGQTYETRITLYVERKGWRFFGASFGFAIARFFSERTIKYFAGIPNPFKNCLLPYVRFSYPEKEQTITTFHAITREHENCEGAVKQCYKTGKVVPIQTEYINNIKLPSDINSLGREEKRKVTKYMNDTGIPYRKLILM